MQLVDRIRRLFVSAQMVFREELDRRLGEATASLERARAELAEVESEVDAIGLGTKFDDLSLARINKRLADARARVQRWEDQVRRVEAAIQVAGEREHAEEAAAKWTETLQRFREREQAAKRLDAAARELADAFRGMVGINARVYESLGRDPKSRPALFDARLVQIVVELLLYGHTERAWLPRQAGLETPATARDLPSLDDRVRKEHAQLVQEFAPRGEPPPEAA